MSLLIAAPEIVDAAASDLANLGSTIQSAVATAAGPTTEVLAPAGDEVSAAIAKLFGGHGQWYQALGARAAAFHDQFVQALSAGSASYAAAEAANVSPLQTVGSEVLGLMGAPAQTLLRQPLIGAGTAAGVIGTGEARAVATISAAASPFVLQQGLTNVVGSVQTGVASLAGSASAAGLNLGSLPAPIGPWANVITGAWTNLQQIGMEIQADPLPILAQVVHNQIGFANAAGSDLQQLWTGVQPYLQEQLPQDLQTLFNGILAGNISSSVNTFNSDLLLGLLPALNPVDQLLQIPGQMSQNYTNVLSQNLPGIGLELLLAPLGPTLGSFQATADALQIAHDAWFAGQPLAALVDLMNVPAAGTGAFLNGYQTQYDIGYTGLLTSAENPLGAPGLVDNLVVQIPQQIATTLAGGGPTATWSENFNDLSSIISSGFGSLF